MSARSEWLTTIFTGISTGIFALQLVVFSKQARRLKETIAAMKEIDKSQRNDIQKSIAASERAAVAAERNAEAITNVERPLLVIGGISIESFDCKMEVAKFLPTIKITNYGRTPAIITRVLLNVNNNPKLRKSYTILQKYPDTIIALPNGEVEYTEYFIFQMCKSMDDVIHRNSASPLDKSIQFYGYIEYSDYLGQTFQKGFVHMYFIDEEKSSDYGDVYTDYDYLREVKSA